MIKGSLVATFCTFGSTVAHFTSHPPSKVPPAISPANSPTLVNVLSGLEPYAPCIASCHCCPSCCAFCPSHLSGCQGSNAFHTSVPNLAIFPSCFGIDDTIPPIMSLYILGHSLRRAIACSFDCGRIVFPIDDSGACVSHFGEYVPSGFLPNVFT